MPLTEIQRLAREGVGSAAAEVEVAAENTTRAVSNPLPKTPATLEEVESAATKVKDLKATAAKNELKDLEIREGILNELKADSTKLARVSKDDLEFLKNPVRLTEEQKQKVLKTILEDYHDWHGLKEAFNGIPPRVSKVEMYKISWHSVQAVQRLYNWGVTMGLLKENPIRSVQKARSRRATTHSGCGSRSRRACGPGQLAQGQ